MAKPENKFPSVSFSLSGILLIDKPEGPSSTQVVEQVKRILGAKKVGHLGTLDPFASGLLPLGINEGTKIAHLFLTAQKSYAGEIALGVETDTQDSTGKVLEVRHVPPMDGKKIKELEEAFTGTLRQTPPMFSALKKEGVRLYRLARQGRTVSRSPREIRVEHLRIWSAGPARLGFEVTCSKGTYIRTLAADMGTFLGCGAHLETLRRTSCGPLTLDRAVSLGDIETMSRQGEIPLISLDEALTHLRPFYLQESLLYRLKKGQQGVLAGLGAPKGVEEMVRVVDAKDHLVALVRWVDEAKRWRLFRVFDG